ncbi:hypothetical protein [uncultured Aureimonas sp.]|uniref:hypothetical protein n=1 Tax=uncultured Aureimonas sp. TaxID=1604662 RepID=UPI0025EB7C85|nr:hypothetical protein [uncultured Aureimonas sp.]
MNLTPEEEAEANRLATVYNERPFDAQTNPGGFGRGGNSAIGLFIKSLRDMVGFGRGVVRVATEALAAITTQANRFSAAVAAIEAGPVTSVNGKTGAVVIDLSELSADVTEQLAEVQATLDGVVAEQASAARHSRAYARAFGD